jgi:DNA ligase-4
VAVILKEMFLKMDAVQQKWFVRLILKEMRTSLSVNSILQAFHPDARDLFDVTANLRKVCERLRDPEVRLNEIEIQLMQPFKPQLADRIPIRSLDKWLKGRACYVETKYDGERLQVHKDGNRFRYFSRNGNDFTQDFGSEAKTEEELLTGYLAPCLASHVNSVILGRGSVS